MHTELNRGRIRNYTTVLLVLVIIAAGLFFSTVGLPAPAFKPPSVVTESGSGTFLVYGVGDTEEIEFIYPEVRHVSLTIAYYSEENSAQGELFAGPYWGDNLRSPYVWHTIFNEPTSDDTPDQIPSETVEFDTDRWKIELKSFSNPEKYALYRYTVTYPKP